MAEQPQFGPPPETWRTRAKRTRPGRMAAALQRQRGAPAQIVRSRLRSYRERGRIPPPAPRRRDVAAVAVIPAGPGSLPALSDTIASLRASEGDALAVVVVDDCTADVRERDVRELWPEVEVIRRSRPSGGPPTLWRTLRLGLRHAVERYACELVVKLDTDALAVGPRLATVASERLRAASERPGMGGSLRVRADGAPEDHLYHAAAAGREARRDRLLAGALERAEATGWRRGDTVQGGALVVTRDALVAAEREGWLAWEPPWDTQIAEDFALSLFIAATGFELVSLGDPDGIFAIANKSLPLELETLDRGPWVAAHSVRAGLNGEPEERVREFFRERRARWPDVGGGAADAARSA